MKGYIYLVLYSKMIYSTPILGLCSSHPFACNMMFISKQILLIPSLLWIWAVFAYAQNQTLFCPEVCGRVHIPYPFGVGDGCYRDEGFEIICNYTNNVSTPFLGFNGFEVMEITTDQVRVPSVLAQKFYDESGQGQMEFTGTDSETIDLRPGPFSFSNTQNVLSVVGCDVFAYITENETRKYMAGCVSLCPKGNTDLRNGSCSGIGCCQTTIPLGLKALIIHVDTVNTQTRSWAMDSGNYSVASLSDGPLTMDVLDGNKFVMVPVNGSVVLDWAVGNETCKEAVKMSKNFACRANKSKCVDSTNGPGYRCKCSRGYEGNPYILHGCRDIDECKASNNCINGTSCINTPGNYICLCNSGVGDGKRSGVGCHNPFFVARFKKRISILVVFIGVGVGVGLLVLLAIGFWSYRELNKRKYIKLKQKFFKQNGGLLLEQQVSSGEGNIDRTKIFFTEDLQKATDNFNESRILGTGGSGTVYKGMLSDGRIVAIKKSKVVDESQIGQFINELVLLSHINHRSVVKLLGCCLETEVPLLAYEFVSNGTLSNHLHDGDKKSSISWEDRLRIAIEIAGALSYLHSSASIPIFHRDIKSSNILLDENYKAKISDFGISRSVPHEKTHLTTLVQGTFGYLDPEYFHSSQFTDKSDVYSFGVVLVELLTGQKPISLTRSEEEKNLIVHFVSSMKENRVFETVETRVLEEGSREELLAVAKLAKRCLKLVGKKRPTMKEVATVLEGLRKSEKQQEDFQEISYNLYDSSTSFSLSGTEGEDTRLMV